MALVLSAAAGFGCFLLGLWPLLFMNLVIQAPPPGLIKLFILFGGSLLGTVGGFFTGLRWIRERGVETWNPAGWGGAGLGIGLGLWMLFSGKLQKFDIWFFSF